MRKTEHFFSALILSLGAFMSLTAILWSQGKGPYGVRGGKFDNRPNGILDLTATYPGSSDVAVYVGDGEGSFCFAGAVDLRSLGTQPHAITTGDFNGDNALDLAVTTLQPGNGRVLILLGSNSSSCSPRFPDFELSPVQPPSAGLNQPEFVVAGDFDRDGRLDLAVANQGSTDITIMLNRGDSFTTRNFAVERAPSALVVGDFANNNKLDLAVANRESNSISILRGNGDGTFGSAINIPVGTNPVALVTADFNGDGCPDLAVANAGSNNVSILMGNRVGKTCTGVFGAPTHIPAGPNPMSIVAADFDNDGNVDLAVANRSASTVSILFGNGDGTFNGTDPLSVGLRPQTLIAGRLREDADVSLTTANTGSNSITILVNNQKTFTRIDCDRVGCTPP